jgi:hypothetical protein
VHVRVDHCSLLLVKARATTHPKEDLISMIKAASFPEAREKRYFLSDYPAVYLDTYITNLVGDFRDATDPAHLDAGQVLFAEYGEGVALTHAHPVDQWQVYVTGSALLAKKKLHLVTVQYTDERVPYGPIEVSTVAPSSSEPESAMDELKHWTIESLDGLADDNHAGMAGEILLVDIRNLL